MSSKELQARYLRRLADNIEDSTRINTKDKLESNILTTTNPIWAKAQEGIMRYNEMIERRNQSSSSSKEQQILNSYTKESDNIMRNIRR